MKRRSPLLLALLLALPGAASAEEGDGGLPPVTVSPRTTFATEPKRANGFVDLAGAIDQHFGRDVTADTNAAVGILEATGPRVMSHDLPAEYFDRLGMPAPPAEGDYVIPLVEFLVARGIAEESNSHGDILDQLKEAHYRPWRAKEFPELAAWVAANEGPLTKVAHAVQRRRFFVPILRPEEGARLERAQGISAAQAPHLLAARSMAQVLVARAMLRLGDGDSRGAWDDSMTLIRLGRLIGQGPFFIDAAVGAASCGLGLRGAVAYIEHAALDSETLRQHITADMAGLPPHAAMAEKMHIANRLMYVDAVLLLQDRSEAAVSLTRYCSEGMQELRQLMAPAQFSAIDWNEALAGGHPWYDRAASALSKPTRTERVEAISALNRDIEAAYGHNFDFLATVRNGAPVPADLGKRMGELVALLEMADASAFETTRGRTEQWDRNLRTALALAAFRSDQGDYPERLDELAPKYLANVPADYFTSMPLKYQRTAAGYLFYSFGPNGRDDGGRHSGGDGPGDDEAVRMPAGER